mgnify:CR=1 FL=1
MRDEKQMMQTLLEVASTDDRIRLVTLEGSRTNVNIARDHYQDYDVSYFVTDMDSFMKSDMWLDVFGKRIFMQKPEDMELFSPELGNWFSYLMLFEDGNRIDLTLIPTEEVETYFENSDGLVEVLLDKDYRVRKEVVPSDRGYWIQMPTPRMFDDCCNEFWWVATYVAKGLARGEILFAIDHLHGHVRSNLLRMMSWKIGIEKGFTFSLGKNYKFIDKHLPMDDWNLLLQTYIQNDEEAVLKALYTCFDLFRTYSKSVAREFEFTYPDYDSAITTYIGSIRDNV